MIKKLLSTTLFLGITALAVAQTSNVGLLKAPTVKLTEQLSKTDFVSNSSNSTLAQKTASVAANDTLWYNFNKYYYLNGGVYAEPMPEPIAGISIRSIGSLFKNTAAVNVNGTYFYAGRKASSTSASVTVNVQVYNCNAAGTPTGSAITATTSVLTGTAIGLRKVMFPAPASVTGNFAVVLNAPTDTITYYMNDAETTTYGENLGLMAVASVTAPTVVTWVNYSQVFTAPSDFEPLISPMVSFNLTSDFTADSPSPYCINTNVNYTNTSSSVFTNPQFNLNQFSVKWRAYSVATPSTSIPTADSVFTWNPGDASPISNVKNYSHTYATNGSYTASLTAKYQCQADDGIKFTDIKTTGVISSLCTGINELDNSEFAVYPNPSNGNVTVKNMTINSNLELFNILGETVYKDKMTSDSKSFDFSNLPTGNYYLKMTNPEGKSSVKKLHFN